MLPGPVFQIELTTSARRRGHYLLRMAYGLLLLAILWQNFSVWRFQAEAGLTTRQMSRFANAAFASLAVAQAFAVVFLTPALVTGTIAGETQRRTLHYLLASRLDNAEIVLGKLAAKVIHLIVFILIGLPVLSLLTLMGGVDPLLVGLSTLATASTAYFLAGLSMLISVHARKVRDAVVSTFALVFAWSLLPALVGWVAPLGWPRLAAWIKPINDWVGATSPFWAADLWTVATTSWMTLADRCRWTISLQLAYGTAFLALAVWRLRPAFLRREGGRANRLDLAQWRWRVLDRPEVGLDPMLWKERYTSRTTGVAKLAGLLMGVAMLGLLAYTTYEFARPAFAEILASTSGGFGPGRTSLEIYLRVVVTALATVMMLGVTTSAASGLTAEREEDTWTSLIATDLTGWEILRAKMFGPVWALRWVVPTVAALAAVGLTAGVVHPMGVALLTVEMAVSVWFGAALGTFLSLRSRSTWRAQTLAIGVLLALNGGYLALCCPIFSGGWPLIGLAITPMIEGYSFMSPQEFSRYLGVFTTRLSGPSPAREFDAGIALAIPSHLALYGLGAAALTIASIQGFDRAAGRPWRPGAPARARRVKRGGKGEAKALLPEMS